MARLARKAAINPSFAEFWDRVFWPDASPAIEDIADVVRPSYVYREELEEIIREPEWMVRDRETIGRFEGDCDDIATLLAAVMLLYGYSVRFVAIRYDPAKDYIQHVFIQAYDVASQTWRTVDLTVPVGTVMTAIEEIIQNA